jgi:ABC-type molybdate transport system substrate-binding protein
MKKIVLATAAAIILSAPLAFAANSTSTATPAPKPLTTAAASLSEQCTTLGAQFDKEEASHKSHKNYKEAVSLRKEGKSLCTAHKEAEGVKKIESALTMIGVKPMVKS